MHDPSNRGQHETSREFSLGKLPLLAFGYRRRNVRFSKVLSADLKGRFSGVAGAKPAASDGVEPYSPYQDLVAGIPTDRIETRMNA